jgi:tetratricopeptide (TPR) repeat protein
LQGSAGQQFKRANQLLAAGDAQAALPLLHSCCRLDPANLEYRQALREALRKTNKPTSTWLGRLAGLADKIRLHLARRAGNPARILEYGEQILAREPGDLGTHLVMAEAAEELGERELAEWLLKQARHEDRSRVTINRALADYYERHKEFKRAVTYWQAVCEAAPDDGEAPRRLKDLLARATIARTLRDRGNQRPSSRQGSAEDD